MISFLQKLEEIKNEPFKFLIQRSVVLLHQYYCSYDYVLRKLGNPPTQDEYLFVQFNGWIQKKLKAKTTLGWAKIILFRSQDEKESLELFFSLYSEFQSQNNFKFNTSDFEEYCKKHDRFKGDLEDVYDFLIKTSKFLSWPSVLSLEVAFNGYSDAKRDLGLPMTKQEESFQGFKDWVQEKLGATSDLSWSHVVLFRSTSDRKSLEMGLSLLDEFYGKS